MRLRSRAGIGLSRAISGAMMLLLATFVRAQEASPLVYGVTFERLEYRIGDESDVAAWDGDAIVGSDEWKLRLQSQAEYEIDEAVFEQLENQLLLQHPISDYFDIKAGIRLDTPTGPNRVYGVLGVQGLAPQWFDVDADLFLSEEGGLSARLDLDYELLITNRLVLTPTAELDFAFSDDPEIGVGSGLSKLELGLRLSYDLLDRTLAPYIGLYYEQLFGTSKSYAREMGEDADGLFFVVGTRLRF